MRFAASSNVWFSPMHSAALVHGLTDRAGCHCDTSSLAVGPILLSGPDTRFQALEIDFQNPEGARRSIRRAADRPPTVENAQLLGIAAQVDAGRQRV